MNEMIGCVLDFSTFTQLGVMAMWHRSIAKEANCEALSLLRLDKQRLQMLAPSLAFLCLLV